MPGEVFGLLGPNGAGKTTTVEILEGLRAPGWRPGRRSSGSTSRPDADALKARIGVSLQTAALYPKLTVARSSTCSGASTRTPRPTDELIELLELGERRDAQTKDLSGGQRQRLAVALALVNDPELVFLDEPTTGLDPAARRSLWDLVAGSRRDGRTILLTTHYMEEAEILCDRARDHGSRARSSRWARSTSSSRSGSRNARSGSTRIEGLDDARAGGPARR